jgi:hypothetical protein
MHSLSGTAIALEPLYASGTTHVGSRRLRVPSVHPRLHGLQPLPEALHPRPFALPHDSSTLPGIACQCQSKRGRPAEAAQAPGQPTLPAPRVLAG